MTHKGQHIGTPLNKLTYLGFQVTIDEYPNLTDTAKICLLDGGGRRRERSSAPFAGLGRCSSAPSVVPLWKDDAKVSTYPKGPKFLRPFLQKNFVFRFLHHAIVLFSHILHKFTAPWACGNRNLLTGTRKRIGAGEAPLRKQSTPYIYK